MTRPLFFLIAATVSLFASAAFAGSDKLMEFHVDGETIQGKVEVLGRSDCWVLERDGRMNRLSLSKVKRFRRVDDKFQPYRAADMRDRLQREFGKEYEVSGAGDYLVCAPRGRARQYAELFDGIYRTFRVNFGARGFRLTSPEFPLVAVVLQDMTSFFAYQKGDGIPINSQLLGYYHPESNRVALYEPRTLSSRTGSEWQSPLAAAEWPRDYRAFGSIQAGLEDTIIHEATHQVAFNTGLHSRVGENPRWVVEGLATVFEADGIRNRNTVGATNAKSRINRGRFIDFMNYVQKRRKEGSLETFVSNDVMLGRAPHDFYAQSWALSFFLVETRSRAYADFLKRIAKRDPLEKYSAEERVADFKSSFGDDLETLETAFLRYLDQQK